MGVQENPFWANQKAIVALREGDSPVVRITLIGASAHVSAQHALQTLNHGLVRSNSDLEQFAYAASHGQRTYSRVRADANDDQPVSMRKSFDQACRNLKDAIAHSAAHITCSELTEVKGNSGQLVQLFQNLIGNAIKFNGGDAAVAHVHALKHK